MLRIQLTKFECLLESGTIFVPDYAIDYSCCRKWEHELGKPIDIEDWRNASTSIFDLPVNIAIREAYLKVRNQWYLVPARLQMYPDIDPHCWRCQKELGSVSHIWWNCPTIKTYCKEVHQQITSKLGLNLDLQPESCLLHLPSEMGRSKRTLLNNLLVA